MTDKFLQTAGDWGYEVNKLPDHYKFNHERGDVYEIEYTAEGSSRTVTIGRCSGEEDAIEIIKKHAAIHEKDLLQNISESADFADKWPNETYYTVGNSASTREAVMNIFNKRFGEVLPAKDEHGRSVFKNRNGAIVGMTEIDGEGDRVWNVYGKNKIKESFSGLREMNKLIPRDKLTEFSDETKIKIGSDVNHGLIGNAKVLRITGNIAEIADKKSGKHFKVQLSSLKLGAVEEATGIAESFNETDTVFLTPEGQGMRYKLFKEANASQHKKAIRYHTDEAKRLKDSKESPRGRIAQLIGYHEMRAQLHQDWLDKKVDEATHRVPAHTFTPRAAVAQPEKLPGQPGYDWRNPNHNPTGKKPTPHKPKGKYNPNDYPVLDDEHGTHLFDPDLVDAIKANFAEWDSLSELEQIKLQISFVSGMPSNLANYDFDHEERKLTVKAKKLQDLIATYK